VTSDAPREASATTPRFSTTTTTAATPSEARYTEVAGVIDLAGGEGIPTGFPAGRYKLRRSGQERWPVACLEDYYAPGPIEGSSPAVGLNIDRMDGTTASDERCLNLPTGP
jgi:hypothetical protein